MFNIKGNLKYLTISLMNLWLNIYEMVCLQTNLYIFQRPMNPHSSVSTVHIDEERQYHVNSRIKFVCFLNLQRHITEMYFLSAHWVIFLHNIIVVIWVFGYL